MESLVYVSNPLLDEEVDVALAKSDPGMIWAMTTTLATMEEETYQFNRSAIKARFKDKLNISGLDRAVFAKRNQAKAETRVASVNSNWPTLML